MDSDGGGGGERAAIGGLINYWHGSRRMQLDSALMVRLGRHPGWG
jgi:hypothetical protein